MLANKLMALILLILLFYANVASPVNCYVGDNQGFANVVFFIQNGSQASRSGEEGAGGGLRPPPAPSSPSERRRREQSERAPTFAKP